MRPARVLAVLLAAALGAGACAAQQPSAPPPSPASNTPDTPSSDAGQRQVRPPPQQRPVRAADCPYLPTALVEQRNGQGVGSVRVSAGNPPSCFFYRPDGERQLRTRVFRGRLEVARALVDAAAPVRTSARASLSGGWEGGVQPRDGGSVYAVAKPKGGRGVAVLVVSNQAQSVKARELAKSIIGALRL